MLSSTDTIPAADERRHYPGPGSLPLWSESYWFPIYDPQTGIGVVTRIGILPNQGLANLWLFISQGGKIVHNATDLRCPLPDGDIDNLCLKNVAYHCLEPLRTWRLSYEAEDYGVDLLWEACCPVYQYPSGAVDQKFNSPVLVDLTPGTGSPGAVLSGTILVSAQQGVAVFSNLAIDLAGANYRLTVLTAGLPPILTAPFTIRNQLPTKITILRQPAGRAQSGQLFAQQPVVAFQDDAGTAVGINGLQITASLASGPAGTLGGTTTMSADANGRVTFTDLAIKGPAGTYTLAFADPTGRVPRVTSTSIALITVTDIGPASTRATVPGGAVGDQPNLAATMRN